MIRCLDTRYGKLFIPDTDTAQYDWFRVLGASVEDQYISLVIDLLAERPRGMFVDVGSNFGCWSLALAPHCTRGLAFEPQPAIHKLLLETLALNKVEVTALRAACGMKLEHRLIPRLDLDRPANFGGIALDQTYKPQADAPKVTVEVIPLDDCVRNTDMVSFIKIDVEGMESQVLLGAQRTIKRCRPIMFVESDHTDTDKELLRQQLEQLGYILDQQGPNFLCIPEQGTGK